MSGVYTQSGFAAPPVQLCRERAGNAVRALVINSGNANAATGLPGRRDAERICAAAATQLGVDAAQILPFSTGVIGERLPVDAIVNACRQAIDCADAAGWEAAGRAIMTTDTVAKVCSETTHVGDLPITVTGIAKGSGMIRPDMATMLAFIACDAAIDRSDLDQLVRDVAARSFNRVTVDGDTSTNDSFVLIATGRSGVDARVGTPAYLEVSNAIAAVAQSLALAIVRDGEGATKLVTVRVEEAQTSAEAAQVAFTVAQSPLVKTALFAGDANWGRFCMAIGRAGITNLDQGRVSLFLDDVPVAKNGLMVDGYSESDAARVMARAEYTVCIRLGRGDAVDEVWTCDLSYDYVKINAEYRT